MLTETKTGRAVHKSSATIYKLRSSFGEVWLRPSYYFSSSWCVCVRRVWWNFSFKI